VQSSPLQRAVPTRGRRALALLSLVAALVVGLLLAGCGGGGGGASAVATTVSGVVQDSSLNDQGVGGATVAIGGVTTTTTSAANATTANPLGSFTIQNAPVGATTAVITPSGKPAQTVAFAPSVSAGVNPPVQLFINIGQIGGTIQLPNGTPAAGAFVSVAVNGDNVQAATDGTFLIINVPLGATTLTAVLGTASLTQAVTVTNGVTALGPIKLVDNPNPNPPGPPATITGRALLGGSAGGAAPGTNVFLLSNGTQIEVSVTDSAGNYSFYVPVGTYSLKFGHTGYQTTSQDVAVMNPSAPVVVPDVTLPPQ
jgi:hypothetical protein